LSNCVVSLNTSEGVVDCTLYDCEVTANNGPGMIRGMAFNSIISSNVSFKQNLGGGATSATLSNCFVFNNSAWNGGGAYNCVLNFCTVSNNQAILSGGGFYWKGPPFQIESPGENSVIIGNTVGYSGGGGSSSVAFNLTNWVFSNNSAADSGGGFVSGNGIIADCIFNGNISGGLGGGISGKGSKVQLIGCNISSNSATGDGGGASDVDLQSCLLSDNSAGSSGGGAVGRTAIDSIFRRNSAAINGGGLLLSSYLGITNCVFEENSAGASGGGLHASAGPIKNSQFSRNSAGSSGGGIYLIGWSILVTNCTLVDNHAKFGGGSYDGSFTGCTIQGNFATNSGGGVYSQFSVSSNNLIVGNSARLEGGGAYGGNWQQCTIRSNTAGNGGGLSTAQSDHSFLSNNTAKTNGGGVYLTTFNNCLLTGNQAQRGGALYNDRQMVYASTICNNSASQSGGGIFASSGISLIGSIVYFNTAPSFPNYSGISTFFTFSCLTPLPPGTGNIDSDPAFIDSANGNFRLQTNSPCINTGGGPSAPVDLDGRLRFVGGHIDMGAYEFQGPGVGEFTGWLEQNGLPTSGSADHQDTDIDRMDNWQEWIAGTSPTNAASLLQMYSPSNTLDGITVAWQSVPGKTYFLQRSSDLATQPSFSSIESNLLGQAGFTSFTDSTATNHNSYFYRVGVQ
jgi:parallel beta-helix repeat protein/predicted outer membrane repeat protein